MRLMILFLIAVLQLVSNPKDPYILAVTEGEPSSLVEGVVSAITGDLYLAQADEIIRGYEPLPMPRYYVSGNGEGQMAGWFFYDYVWATMTCEGPYQPSESYLQIVMQNQNGSPFSFTGSIHHAQKQERKHRKQSSKWHEPTIFTPVEPSSALGITNTAKGWISAHTNFKNARIELAPSGKSFVLGCPDGTQRSYAALGEQNVQYTIAGGEWVRNGDDWDLHEPGPIQYLLTWERLPNGNMRFYAYDASNRLQSIRTAAPGNAKTYASATISYPNENAIIINTSDGKTIQYHFNSNVGKRRQRLMYMAASSHSPPEIFSYYGERNYCGQLIKRIASHSNRFYDIDYYWNDHNDVGGGLTCILPPNGDARSLRVKHLKAPVGSDATPLITHRFIYNPGAHSTDIYEIDGTLTKYFYTPAMRLKRIERRTPSQTLVNSESFVWSPTGSILCRTFSDSYGTPLFSRRFFYDGAGNVTEERLYGNLSGFAQFSLILGEDGFPKENGCEIAVTRCQYSQDGRNLLVRKDEPSGKTTLYTYHPQLVLPVSELLCESGQIKIRHFYEYNHENVLVREVVDDGYSPDPNDIRGVKTRKITVITPMQGGPYPNMPGAVEEKYWDGQKEVSLKKTILQYGTGGLVTQKDIYDASGTFCYSLKTSYNAYGFPVLETNALGQTAQFGYDDVGNKIFSQDFGGRRSLKTDYDFSNRPIRVEEKGDDGICRITYHSYDWKHNKVSTTDSFGNETRHVYDSSGNLLETHLPEVSGCHPILYSSYDNAGRVVSRTDANGNMTRTEYNARSQVTRIQHPDGGSEQFLYNIDGTLKSHIDVLGAKTEYGYDVFGHLVSKVVSFQGEVLSREVYVYDSFHLLQKIDAEGNVTKYFYDGAGRKVAEEVGEERTEYGYDVLGRRNTVCKGSLITVTTYDLLDRPIAEKSQDLQGKVFTQTLYSYDAAGNPTSTIRYPANVPREECFLFDSVGRVVQTVDPLGHITRVFYDENHREGNCRVLQKTVTDPLGMQTIETYDSLGRLVRLEKKNPFGETLSLEEQTYDAGGNLLSHTASIFALEAPPRTSTTLWEYGSCNRLKTLTEGAGCSEQKVTQYTYTPAGQIFKITKPDRVILENSYDLLGQHTGIISSDGSVAYAFFYNRIGQRIESRDLCTGASVYRSFDSQGRLLDETLPLGLHFKKSYDSSGRCVSLQLPDDSSVRYSYDAAHIRKVERFSPSGQMRYVHSYTDYDLDGNLLQEIPIGADGSRAYSIDPLGRFQSVCSKLFSQTITVFDPVGNIRSMIREGEILEFTYDELYQLSSEKGHVYLHDSQYNRIAKDKENYTLNSLHQMTGQCAYDPCGNLIEQDGVSYTYDALDRVVTVDGPDFHTEMTYDAYNRMLSKTTDCPAFLGWIRRFDARFLYDGSLEIGAVDSSGELSQLRILHPQASSERGASLAFELYGNTYIPVHDLFGNIAAIATLEGKVIESYSYTAFGEETVFNPWGLSDSSMQMGNPWRYCSKRVDAETGLAHFGQRLYCPAYGRWLTPDPSGFTDSYNLYAFVYNNPFTGVDLFGLATESHIGFDLKQGFYSYEFDPLKCEEYQPASYRDHRYFNTDPASDKLTDLRSFSGESRSMRWHVPDWLKMPIRFQSQLTHEVIDRGGGFLRFGCSFVSSCFGGSWRKTDSSIASFLDTAHSFIDDVYGTQGQMFRLPDQCGQLEVPCFLKGRVGFVGETAQKVSRVAQSNRILHSSKSAYEVAKAGGRNAGFLNNNLYRSTEEIKKGIVSLEKQIALHRGKISNPNEYLKEWNSLDPRQQQALVNKKWPSDIQRQIEQKEILQKILSSRKNG